MNAVLSFLTSQAALNSAVSAVLAFGSALLMRTIIGRGKIGWGVSHQYVFTLQQQQGPLLAYTKQLWIQNIGRSIAEDVEIILSHSPAHFEVWPQRAFTQSLNPSNNIIIKFDNLNRREHVTIMMFQTVNSLPLVTNVRWKGGVGREVRMGPQQIFPRPFTLLLQALILIGFFSLFFFAGHILF